MQIAANSGHSLPLSSILPFQHEMKTLSDESYIKLRREIEETGFSFAVHVWQNNGQNYCLDGHQRIECLRRMGNERIEWDPYIPVVYVEAVSFQEAKRKCLAAASQYGTFNADGVKLMLRDADMPVLKAIEHFEFPSIKLGKLVPEDEQEVKANRDDAVPDAIQSKCQPGQLWALGGHRMMCGDATNGANVAVLLGGGKPILMVTDPPYGVSYEADWRAKAKDCIKTDRETTSNLQNDDRADWKEAYELFPGDIVYVWHASAFSDVVMDSIRRAGFDVKQQIIWNKNLHVLSRSHYHWKHEPCWYAQRTGAPGRWLAGRDQMTVWDVKSIIFEKDKTSHPTQKPVKIYEIPIENHTKKGESVYDPFGGSGSQIIAAENLGRKSFTMEIDPKFCDVIIARWEQHTGRTAELMV